MLSRDACALSGDASFRVSFSKIEAHPRRFEAQSKWYKVSIPNRPHILPIPASHPQTNLPHSSLVSTLQDAKIRCATEATPSHEFPTMQYSSFSVRGLHSPLLLDCRIGLCQQVELTARGKASVEEEGSNRVAEGEVISDSACDYDEMGSRVQNCVRRWDGI